MCRNVGSLGRSDHPCPVVPRFEENQLELGFNRLYHKPVFITFNTDNRVDESSPHVGYA